MASILSINNCATVYGREYSIPDFVIFLVQNEPLYVSIFPVTYKSNSKFWRIQFSHCWSNDGRIPVTNNYSTYYVGPHIMLVRTDVLNCWYNYDLIWDEKWSRTGYRFSCFFFHDSTRELIPILFNYLWVWYRYRLSVGLYANWLENRYRLILNILFIYIDEDRLVNI